MPLQPQVQGKLTCRAQSYVGSIVLLDSDIQRPPNSGLHLPSAIFKAQFQDIGYLSLRQSAHGGEGVMRCHGSCCLAFPFLSETYCPEAPSSPRHLPLGMLPAELGRVWPCRAAAESPACSSGSGWRHGSRSPRHR